jgi:hypothetical protein
MLRRHAPATRPGAAEIPRDTDSLLEGTGFEPSVPRGKGPTLRVSVLFHSDFSVGGEPTRGDIESLVVSPMVRILFPPPASQPPNLLADCGRVAGRIASYPTVRGCLVVYDILSDCVTRFFNVRSSCIAGANSGCRGRSANRGGDFNPAPAPSFPALWFRLAPSRSARTLPGSGTRRWRRDGPPRARPGSC